MSQYTEFTLYFNHHFREDSLGRAFYDKKVERQQPLKIIKIDISRIPLHIANMIINLTNETVLEYFLPTGNENNVARCFAKGAHEVLFQDEIPRTNDNGENVFELLENPTKPPQPKKK